ncbi:MAG: hypothetical protein GY722_12615 [bacterium]|nr:hypothetical protein [bacterium]
MREVERRIARLENRNPVHDPGVLCLFTTGEDGEEVLLATAPPDGPPPETELVLALGPPLHFGVGLAYLRHVFSDGWQIPVPMNETDFVRASGVFWRHKLTAALIGPT